MYVLRLFKLKVVVLLFAKFDAYSVYCKAVVLNVVTLLDGLFMFIAMFIQMP